MEVDAVLENVKRYKSMGKTTQMRPMSCIDKNAGERLPVSIFAHDSLRPSYLIVLSQITSPTMSSLSTR